MYAHFQLTLYFTMKPQEVKPEGADRLARLL